MFQTEICNCGYGISTVQILVKQFSIYMKHPMSQLFSSWLKRRDTSWHRAQQLHGWIPLIPPVLKPYWPWRFQKGWFAWSWRWCDELNDGVARRWLRWDFNRLHHVGLVPEQVGTQICSQCSPKELSMKICCSNLPRCIAWLWNEVELISISGIPLEEILYLLGRVKHKQ